MLLAFFPCIYFCAHSQMLFYWTHINYRKKTIKEKTDLILQRSHNRETYFRLAVKMMAVAKMRGLRLIMENPWSEQTFLKANFVAAPTVVDMNRMKRGDYFKKPTAYWFVNCEPTDGFTHQEDKQPRTIITTRGSKKAGVCSEDRSMISPDYAHNWICDFVLGIPG